MTPHPDMPIDEIIAHYVKCGRNVGLPLGILSGGLSHADKWHAFDIVTHVRLTVFIAKMIVKRGAPSELISSTAWHDIGKTIAVQHTRNGLKFHGHAATGAAYLQEAGNGFSPNSIRAILHHGSLQKLKGNEPIKADGGPLWAWLEVCDELGKWTDEFFPPKGSLRTIARRIYVLSRLREYLPEHFDISGFERDVRIGSLELVSSIT